MSYVKIGLGIVATTAAVFVAIVGSNYYIRYRDAQAAEEQRQRMWKELGDASKTLADSFEADREANQKERAQAELARTNEIESAVRNAKATLGKTTAQCSDQRDGFAGPASTALRVAGGASVSCRWSVESGTNASSVYLPSVARATRIGSTDSDIPTQSASFDFGSGNTGGGATSTFSFSEPGTYVVSLTIDGAAVGNSVTVEVLTPQVVAEEAEALQARVLTEELERQRVLREEAAQRAKRDAEYIRELFKTADIRCRHALFDFAVGRPVEVKWGESIVCTAELTLDPQKEVVTRDYRFRIAAPSGEAKWRGGDIFITPGGDRTAVYRSLTLTELGTHRVTFEIDRQQFGKPVDILVRGPIPP